MTTFIFDVLSDLHSKGLNLSGVTFILPSKRAGLFLKHELTNFIEQPIFAPQIISIEEFVEELSQLKKVSNTELLFKFYDVYSKSSKSNDIEPFNTFSKWGQVLLQDFNEIDRHLVEQGSIFNYLSAIKEIEHQHWSIDENQTDFIKKYLSFWNKLSSLYNVLSESLLEKKEGYQGLIYREASNNVENYIKNNPDKQHVFLGFNALNTAEETIIQTLLDNRVAEIYWNIDSHFIDNPIHDAGLFTRQHRSSWNHFKHNAFNWITNNYKAKKNISIIGTPKLVGQAKQVGNILEQLKAGNPKLENTAVVLGEENLLLPVLNSLPTNLDALNITMGLPLKSVPLGSLFQILFETHKKATNNFYYKDVLKVLSNQYIRPLFINGNEDHALNIIKAINTNNIIYLTTTKLKDLAPSHQDLINLLFLGWNESISNVISKCIELIILLKNHFNKGDQPNLLSLEYLFRFNELFNTIRSLNETYNQITDLPTLNGIYNELLDSETLDFQGEPLQGLQIMGMLESRVLNFETVIITSVNEGILPSGKSNNSFIPFDVKLENKLPTYKEKDAVYTYHFYQLLQRAKNIYILYNTEADVLTGGEKSRFITQLELERIHDIKHTIRAPEVPIIKKELKVVDKNVDIIDLLKSIARKGFSPSSLTNYIRNPIDFYYEKVLKIKELEDVEETVAANTLGTVVHNTLEDFYKPLINTELTVDIIKNLKPKIHNSVAYHFNDTYKEGDITKGKNLIIFEIAKRYVSNFLDLEIESLEAGNSIKILAVEAENNISIDIPELSFPVFLTGKVDRVDQYNGVTRIIDYKTGSVLQNQVEVVNWEDITKDYKKYSKSFQVLTYAYLLNKCQNLDFPLEAGIISFKNLSSGFIKFMQKDKHGNGAKKNSLITQETLNNFELQLKQLIIEICNPNMAFTEKEI